LPPISTEVLNVRLPVELETLKNWGCGVPAVEVNAKLSGATVSVLVCARAVSVEHTTATIATNKYRSVLRSVIKWMSTESSNFQSTFTNRMVHAERQDPVARF
jgi:hypothetical protein